MSVTVGQALTSIWRRMGTKENDPEYPRDQMRLYLTLAVGELHSDCAKLAFGDVLLVRGRSLVATADRTYRFAEQTPPITSWLQVRRVRLANGSAALVPVAAESLDDVEGYAFALGGVGEGAVLYTNASVASRAALTIDYTDGPPAPYTSDNDELPAWLPDQYRDVVELMVAQMALPQGGESRLPDALVARLEDRRAQLWTHWSARTPGPAARRM